MVGHAKLLDVVVIAKDHTHFEASANDQRMVFKC